MQTLQKLRRILNRNTKIKFTILVIAIIIGAMLETLALSIISPFISIILDPSIIQRNIYIKAVYSFLGFQSATSFLALLSFLLAAVYIFRGIYLYVLAKAQHRFIARQRVTLSGKLLEKILSYSYIYHSSRNVAEIQRIVVTDVEYLFILMNNILLFLSDALMALFIMLFLLFVSPYMTLCVICLAAICVIMYFKVFRSSIQAAGEQNRVKYIEMTKSVNQALGGIKEVKALRRESHFQKVFKESSNEFIYTNQRNQVLNTLPKLFIEAVCFGGAFIIVGTSILLGADMVGLVPQLSLFVLAAFRLLPAVARLVSYVNQIIFYKTSVDGVYSSLFEDDDNAETANSQVLEMEEKSHDIIIKDVTYRYPNMPEPVLEQVSFVIPQRESVALVGSSGVGKTTLADVILGILTPQEGAVYYDGKSVHQNFEEWSRQIGYIPQQIYMLDESIRENVAFGIDKQEIDEKKVWYALEQAQLKEFVKTLPDGLNTVVGDRGIRLSGGQRQRIGIARAMYEDPPILVMDEATSSLDNETEKAVIDAIMGFQGNKTMLIVAHRLSTIEHCDIVYKVEDKGIVRER